MRERLHLVHKQTCLNRPGGLLIKLKYSEVGQVLGFVGNGNSKDEMVDSAGEAKTGRSSHGCLHFQ